MKGRRRWGFFAVRLMRFVSKSHLGTDFADCKGLVRRILPDARTTLSNKHSTAPPRSLVDYGKGDIGCRSRERFSLCRSDVRRVD